MNKILIIACLSLLFFLSVEARETSDLSLAKIQVVPIKDTQSDKQYELYIKLPEGYSENEEKAYPVLYYTDALWHVELLSGTTEFIMEDAILVGISWQKNIDDDLKKDYGEHVSRFTDYSFWKKSNPKHPKLKFGQANNHLNFIRKDVFNYVEKNYRTDPSNRSYFGYSLSGLFGAYILVTQSDTFKNYILGSPSVDLLTEYEIGFANKNLNANVFISNGSLETTQDEPNSEFVKLLKTINDDSLSVEHAVIEGSHQTAFPMTGVRAVTWLADLTTEEK